MTEPGGGQIGPLQWRVLASSFIGWMFDGFETSTLILVGGVAVSSFLPDASPDAIRLSVGTALSATLAGWAVGGVIGSVMADYVGRKKMLMISIAGYCAFTALTAASVSIGTLIALRFITGLFLGSEWSTGTALVAETWPDHARAKALGVMQSGYGFGFFLAAGLWLVIQPFGPEAWRWMFVIGVLPAIALVYIRREVGESKLWEETAAERQSAAVKRDFTVVELFQDREARSRAAATLVMAAVTVSVFYAISGLTGPFIGALAAKEGGHAPTWASISALVYNGGAIVGYISAGFLAEALGRKRYMYLSFTGAILSGLLMYAVPQSLLPALVAVFILGMFTLGVFSWMPIYLPELFATRIRATASGVVFNLGRLVAFPLPILTAFLFRALGGYQSTVLAISGLYIVSLLMLLSLPETKNNHLPT